MITLAENGMGKIQQDVVQAETDRRRKWPVFVENIWRCLANQITEKVWGLETMFNGDVQTKLDTVC